MIRTSECVWYSKVPYAELANIVDTHKRLFEISMKNNLKYEEICGIWGLTSHVSCDIIKYGSRRDYR